MNAKKLVVAALSASMILTATPAFAKETAKAEPTKVSAEQQYIISLLEQVVAGDKAAVANAKAEVAEAEKAMKADPYLNAALVKVQAKEYAVKIEEEKLAKIYTDLSDAMKAIVDNYMKKGATVADYKLAKDNAAVKFGNLNAEKALLEKNPVTNPDEEAAKQGHVTSDNKIVTTEQFGNLAAGSYTVTELKGALATEKAAKNTAKVTALEGIIKNAEKFIEYRTKDSNLTTAISEAQDELDKAAKAYDKAIKVTNKFPSNVDKQAEKEWETLHSLDYFLQLRAVEDAKAALAGEQAAYAKVVAESKVAQKYEAAKAALVAAEEKLAKDEKALADAKAGIKAGDKELVVDGSNGKKQVPNTADAE